MSLFTGLTLPEIAEHLGVWQATVDPDWCFDSHVDGATNDRQVLTRIPLLGKDPDVLEFLAWLI